MADHPRLAVLKALTAQIEGAAVVDGYTHDLAGKVFRGRMLFGENDPVPFVSILESPRPDTSSTYTGDNSVRYEQWPLLIQGFAKDDPANPTDPLYPLLADVEERLARLIAVADNTGYPLFPSEFLLPDTEGNPQIVSLEIAPPVVRPPSNEPTAKACFLLSIRIGLAGSVG